MMHIIGFEHEHQRPDRDKYVTINWDLLNNTTPYEISHAAAMTDIPYDYMVKPMKNVMIEDELILI